MEKDNYKKDFNENTQNENEEIFLKYNEFIDNLLSVLQKKENFESIIYEESTQQNTLTDYLRNLSSEGELISITDETEDFYSANGYGYIDDDRIILKIKYLVYSNPEEETKILEFSDFLGLSMNNGQWKIKGMVWKDPGNDVSNASLSQLENPATGEEICIIHTSAGDIKIKLFEDIVSKTAENFKTHAKEGYYNGCEFFRTINEFMIQGGDPTNTGHGGESIWGGSFKDEFSRDLNHFRGAVSMANAGPNTNGSQFFIVQKNQANPDHLEKIPLPLNVKEKYNETGGCPHLDGRHAVFGQVFEGMEVVDEIASYPVNENARPETPAKILGIEFDIYG